MGYQKAIKARGIIKYFFDNFPKKEDNRIEKGRLKIGTNLILDRNTWGGI